MLLFRDDWDKKLTPGELADLLGSTQTLTPCLPWRRGAVGAAASQAPDPFGAFGGSRREGTRGRPKDGRSTSYFQFMLNVQSQIEAKQMGPRHIVPLAVTSVVGARYLKALGATPDIIYLDSAHESDETFIELALYYHTLAPGGVVFGDDFSWESVQGDVKRFAAMHNLQVQSDGVTWTLQKPQQR